MKVLIIENDTQIAESVSLTLQIRLPDTDVVSTHLGKKGIELAQSEVLDIIILDLGLPDMSGFEVLGHIRIFSSVPIVILSAKAYEADIVRALECGADDYMVKPPDALELTARIKARIDDKEHFAKQTPISFGPFRFNPPTRQLLYGEKEINLTAIEAHIIHYLMRSEGRVASSSSLAEEVWGHDYPGSVDALGPHIRCLRQKLEADPNHPQLILTKPGIGYFLAKPS